MKGNSMTGKMAFKGDWKPVMTCKMLNKLSKDLRD